MLKKERENNFSFPTLNNVGRNDKMFKAFKALKNNYDLIKAIESCECVHFSFIDTQNENQIVKCKPLDNPSDFYERVTSQYFSESYVLDLKKQRLFRIFKDKESNTLRFDTLGHEGFKEFINLIEEVEE